MAGLNIRKLLGYTLLAISCIAWAVLPVIPFLDISTAAKASWGAGVFIFAEVTWWLAVPLLGKEFIEWCQAGWQWTKQRWQKCFGRGQTSQLETDQSEP